MTCCHCQGVDRMFDDKVVRRQLRHYRRKGGPARATRQLVDAIAASLDALVAAREAAGYPRYATVYMSDQSHSAHKRAVKIVGIRPDRARLVPSDDRFRIDLGALARMVAEDRAAGLVPDPAVDEDTLGYRRARSPLDNIDDSSESTHVARMRRSLATLALLALSWSQLVAFHCDMGGPAPGNVAGHEASAPAHHDPAAPLPADHHHPATSQAPAAPHGGHGDTDGCPMVLACGSASARPAQVAAVVHFPAVLLRATFFAAPIPATADPAVETPPPRYTV